MVSCAPWGSRKRFDLATTSGAILSGRIYADINLSASNAETKCNKTKF